MIYLIASTFYISKHKQTNLYATPNNDQVCFLGSKAYPAENAYKQHLSQHGGKSNASTSMSHTTYQFDILAHQQF
jgi:hypothetical protein